MAAYTDDDVTAAAAALVALVKQHPLTGQAPWDAAIGVYGAPTERDLVAAVLDAVAPAIAARAEVRGIEKALARVDRYQAEHDREVAARALREAADAHQTWYRPEYGLPPERYVCDECGQRWPCPTGAWLRARAEQIDPMPDTFAGTEWERRT